MILFKNITIIEKCTTLNLQVRDVLVMDITSTMNSSTKFSIFLIKWEIFHPPGFWMPNSSAQVYYE